MEYYQNNLNDSIILAGNLENKPNKENNNNKLNIKAKYVDYDGLRKFDKYLI